MTIIEPQHITHADLAEFADSKVNLKSDRAKQYREQAARVRDHIENYAKDNPDIGFVKTLLSGSLAKHTALKTIHDIDIALYIKSEGSPRILNDLLNWLRDSLLKTYPSTTIDIDPPCVVIRFSGTDLDVEVMPVLYEDNDGGYGTIWDPYSLTEKYTSIPRHNEFLAKRRVKQSPDFAQVVRFLKYWKNVNDLEFRSFLIELLVSEVADSGEDFSSYPAALLACFNRILSDDLENPVIFTDYFPKDKFPSRTTSAMEFWDPVTPDNNVASDYSTTQRSNIADAAESAADAISYAATSSQKGDAVDCWKDVFGASFNP